VTFGAYPRFRLLLCGPRAVRRALRWTVIGAWHLTQDGRVLGHDDGRYAV
jgi:hypothetical protein